MLRSILLLTLATVSSGLASKATDQPKKSPNILFVISDDQFPKYKRLPLQAGENAGFRPCSARRDSL